MNLADIIETVKATTNSCGAQWSEENSPLIVSEACRLESLKFHRLLDIVSLTRELLDNDAEALAMQLMNMCFGDRPTWRGVCAQSFAIKMSDVCGESFTEQWIEALINDTKFKMTPLEWEKSVRSHHE